MRVSPVVFRSLQYDLVIILPTAVTESSMWLFSLCIFKDMAKTVMMNFTHHDKVDDEPRKPEGGGSSVFTLLK